jgi:O-antigen/teichoic acid export membrane protein
LLAKTLGFVLSMALPLVLARRMEQVQLGLYKQAFLVVATAINVLPLGFGTNAYYFLPREPKRSGSVILNILLFHGIIGAVAALGLAAFPELLGWILHDDGIVPEARLIGLTILLWNIGACLDVIVIARGEIRMATAIIVSLGVVRTVAFLVAALLFGDVHAMVWAGIVYGFVVCVVLAGYIHWRVPGFVGSFSGDLMREQIAYSLPLGLAWILFVVQTDLHNYVVANRFGPALFAVYSIGTFQLPLVQLLQESANSVLIPTISRLQQQNAKREIVYLIARAMRKLAAVLLPVLGFLIVTGKEFVLFLFTEVYRDSWPFFAVNLAMLLVWILVLDPLYRAYPSEHGVLIRVRIFVDVILITALWLGTAYFGMIAAICSVVGVALLERVLLVTHFGKIIGVSRKDIVLLKDLGKLAIASGAAAIAATFLKLYWIGGESPLVILLACGLLFGLVYAAVALLLGVLTGDERTFLQSKLATIRVFN